MFETVCNFSGYAVPRGRGIKTVKNDSRVVFTKSKRERTFIKSGISPKSIKWTDASRTFYSKLNQKGESKKEFEPITKIVRGYSCVPRSIAKEEGLRKTPQKSQSGVKIGEKAKNQNKINLRR